VTESPGGEIDVDDVTHVMSSDPATYDLAYMPGIGRTGPGDGEQHRALQAVGASRRPPRRRRGETAAR
jgi:hypothetical protein